MTRTPAFPEAILLGPLSAQSRRSMSLGAAAGSPSNYPKAPLKTHSRFLALKRSQPREFRVVQKSTLSHKPRASEFSEGYDMQKILAKVSGHATIPAWQVSDMRG
jgi:hypothetical protein